MTTNIRRSSGPLGMTALLAILIVLPLRHFGRASDGPSVDSAARVASGLGVTGVLTTATPSATPTEIMTPTATMTGTLTATPMVTATSTLTATATSTVTLTATPTATPSVAATATISATATATETVTATATITTTATATMTVTATPTMTTTATVTPTGTVTTTATPTTTVTATSTVTTTATVAPTATATLPPPPSALTLPFSSSGEYLGPGDVGTGVQVQNLDATSAVSFTARIRYPWGEAALTLPRSAPPGGAPNFYLPTLTDRLGLPRGLFGITVDGDGPLGAIVRTDWFETGGSAIYSAPEVGDEVLLPIVERHRDGRNSVVSFMNAGDEGTVVTVEYWDRDGAAARMRVVGAYQLAAHASTRLFMAHESDLSSLNEARGWLRVFTDRRAPVSVQAFTLVDKGLHPIQAVYGYEGVPLSATNDRLFVPLFRSAQRGVLPADRLDTEVVVLNPTMSQVTARMTYYGSNDPAASAACRGGVFNQVPVQIAARSHMVISQAPGPGHNLPADCFGTAVLETDNASQRIAAVVVDKTNGDALLSAYDAQPASRAATRVALPLIRRNHVGLSTGIQVMNTGAGPATVRIAFSATNAATDASTPILGCTTCVQTVAPFQSYTWWPPIIAAIPDSTFGSAVVTSDQPVVVLVNDYPMRAQYDPSTYLGIPAQ